MRQALLQQFQHDEAITRLEAWQQLLQELNGTTESEQLAAVNKFFHQRIRYRLDQDLYGEVDYWASVLQTLGHGLGDCEDWAIAQYISLRQLGISDKKLRLIYVKARVALNHTEAHMVLGYYATPNSPPLILDSLKAGVTPASERLDLTPVFSFNGEGLWAGQGNQRANSSPTARLSRWRDVLERMQVEGIQFKND
ncbi:MAG: transglutaminase-like cysteine peptidase [Venatoribacter sp.]